MQRSSRWLVVAILAVIGLVLVGAVVVVVLAFEALERILGL